MCCRWIPSNCSRAGTRSGRVPSLNTSIRLRASTQRSAKKRVNISIIGQITHSGNNRSSHLSFISPGRGIFSPQLTEMMDHLAVQAGTWGTFHLLVDADEHSQYFDALRKSGFSVYAWQRIWKFQPNTTSSHLPGFEVPVGTWQTVEDRDSIGIKTLCQSLIPALVQPVEPLFDRKLDGFLRRTEGTITGYAEIIQGREGLWVQPFIHPADGECSRIINGSIKHDQ